MANYRISGIWRKNDGVITDYALHDLELKANRARKVPKAEAVRIVEAEIKAGGTVLTWLWNYSQSMWEDGGEVIVMPAKVVGGEKYLQTTHDDTVRDNLLHLIDYDWIARQLKVS